MGGLFGTRRDWPFAAYIAFACVMFATSGMSTVRLRGAFNRFGDCAARADAECAAAELATAKSIDASNIRTKVAQAELHAVLGEAALADRALAQAVAGTKDSGRDRATRADLLLLAGDLAALHGRDDEARARWIEAAPLVDDDSLVELRRARLDASRGAATAALSDQLTALHTGLDQLLEKARTGDTASTTEQKAVIDAQIERLPPSMRGPFQRAGYACANVANAAASRRRADGMPIGGSGWTPTEPVPPTDEQLRHAPWLKAEYERRRDAFFKMKEMADDQHYNALKTTTTAIQSATDSEERAVASAQRLIDAAFADGAAH